MKRSITRALLCLTGAAVLLMTACSKAPEQGKHIPKTAAMVMGINSKQIQDKLVAEGITMENVFATLQQQDTSNAMGKALQEAANSGVDLTGDVYLALVPGDKGKTYFAGYAKLKDAAKFEAFLKEKTKSTIKTGTDFKYAVSGDGLVGFDNSTVIGLFNFDMNKYQQFDPEGNTVSASGPAQDEKAWADELNKLFHLKSDDAITSVESYKDVLKDKGDVTFWMSGEQFYGLNPAAGAAGMAALVSTNMKKLMAGSYQTAAAHFEQGKIRMNTWAYSGKEMQDIMKKYPMDKVDMSMLETYPSENVTGFVVMNFDLRLIGDLLKITGMDGFANMGLAEAGITLDDVLRAFKGEIALIGSDFSVISQPSPWDSSYKITKPEVKWAFNMKVADKAAFEKVMNAPMMANIFTKQGDEYLPKQPLGEVALSINSKRLMAASDAALLQSYSEGKGKIKLEEGIANKVKGNAMGMYLSVEKLVNNIPAEEMKLPDSIVNDLKGLMKDFTAISEPFNGKSQKSIVELTFKNENQNAIGQIHHFATKMFRYYAAHKIEEKSWDPAMDTVAAPIDSTMAQ